MIKTISEARNGFNAIVVAAAPTFVTRNGKPVAAVVPYEEYRKMYQAWAEKKDQEIIEAAKKIQKGEMSTLTEEEVLKALDGTK